ncbi:hypothetical protein, partial [Nonomuraea lactucae]|uniref:hypothetical protein n=1 Tax=Nonomuraea lactucae TaxID=2249762 RepID=UPI0013B379D2
AVIALAAATGGWMVRRAGWPERAVSAGAAVALLYLEPASVVTGLALLAVALLLHLALRRPNPLHRTQKGT